MEFITQEHTSIEDQQNWLNSLLEKWTCITVQAIAVTPIVGNSFTRGFKMYTTVKCYNGTFPL